MYNESFVNMQIDALEKRIGGIAIELGANHGMHTRKIAEKFDTVYAFEPHPDNIKVLQGAIKHYPHVEVIEAAVVPVPGKVKLYNCPNPGGHTISEDVMGHRIWGHNPDSYHEVQGIVLDDFCRNRKISFLKSDIEGAENTIFDGAIETLKNNKMDILIEIHRFVDCDRLFKFFTDLGYQIFDIDGIGRPTTFIADNHYIVTNRV